HVSNTGGDGLWLHPDSATIHSTLSDLMPEGQTFDVECFKVGDSVEGDAVWLYGTNETTGHKGYAADFYIDTDVTQGNEPRQLREQGIPECGTTSSQPAINSPSEVKSCYFDMIAPSRNLTFSYQGDHLYYGNAWQAAKNWSDLDAGVSIQPAGDNPAANQAAYIQIKDVYWPGSDIIANADVTSDTAQKEVPKWPTSTKHITVFVNIARMEEFNSSSRTYVLTHELGHTLGLAHSDKCGYHDESIMNSNGKDLPAKAFNTPREFDKMELMKLYETPTY
ncbi:MAG TPA: M57 family metalloprotease, partial [Ktedonobacteraceae bacterium]|nr:M57 family metalloprotease [Ktedonobacteraceae bacterium]